MMKVSVAKADPSESGDKRLKLLVLAKEFLRSIDENDLSLVCFTDEMLATENGRAIDVGEGIWKKANRVASQQFFVDVESAQVMIIGAVLLNTGLYPYGIRLKYEGSLISELEVLVSPSANGHFADVNELLKPDVLYDAPVPPERGCSNREKLRIEANKYWDALNASDGSLASFNHRCDRYGNGKKITNSLDLLLSPDAAVHTPASLITATRPARPRVVERRFPVLDTERGVAASVTIVEFGENKDRADVGAFYIFGVVKIVDNEFRNIDHVHAILPKGTRTHWL